MGALFYLKGSTFMSRRFVPQHVIDQRVQAKDDRYARELRARFPRLAPEVLGFASIEIVRDEPPADDSDPFGPPPTETVQSPFGDLAPGYTKPGRWCQDGRP